MRGLKLTVYFGERDRAGRLSTTEALGRLFAREGVRLAVLVRGIEGFGLKHRLQTHRLLTLSEDLPLVWVAVDETERIERLAQEVDVLIPEGLVTLERVQVAERPEELLLDDGGAGKLTVYLGRGERANGRLAYLAVVDRLRELGVEGATVLLGIDGVRAGRRESARLLGANLRVPVMIICVGRTERLVGALRAISELAPEPIATLERVRLLKRDGVHLDPSLHPAAEDPSGLGVWSKIMVFTGEDSPGEDGPLYVDLVRRLRAAGASGASVLGGVWGYSGSAPPHGDRFLSLRRGVPVVCVVVDRPRRMELVWPEIDRLTCHGGLVTGELVPAFRATGPGARVGGLRLAATD